MVDARTAATASSSAWILFLEGVSMSMEFEFNSARSHKPASNFSTQLFVLIFKADPINTEKLRLGYPEHVQMVEDFRAGKLEAKYYE